MAVDTKKVEGRRELHFDSYDEMLAEAEQLASGDAKTSGNWSLGQILMHLAMSMNAAVDGMDVKVPFVMKIMIKLFMNKDKMLNKTVPAGFKIPKSGEGQFMPGSNVSIEEGLAALRAAVERSRKEPAEASHPAFGPLTEAEWTKANLRHAELHLSFAETP